MTTTVDPEIAALWREHLTQIELTDDHGYPEDPTLCEQIALASKSDWARGYWLGRAATLREFRASSPNHTTAERR